MLFRFPSVSDLKALDIYYFMCFLYVFLCLLEFAAASYRAKRMPPNQKSIDVSHHFRYHFGKGDDFFILELEGGLYLAGEESIMRMILHLIRICTCKSKYIYISKRTITNTYAHTRLNIRRGLQPPPHHETRKSTF